MALLAEPSGALRGVRVGLPRGTGRRRSATWRPTSARAEPTVPRRVPASARLASLLGKLSATARGMGK